MENNAQIAFWINVYNALVMHVKDHIIRRLFLLNDVSIWNPSQLFEEVSLVS